MFKSNLFLLLVVSASMALAGEQTVTGSASCTSRDVYIDYFMKRKTEQCAKTAAEARTTDKCAQLGGLATSSPQAQATCATYEGVMDSYVCSASASATCQTQGNGNNGGGDVSSGLNGTVCRVQGNPAAYYRVVESNGYLTLYLTNPNIGAYDLEASSTYDLSDSRQCQDARKDVHQFCGARHEVRCGN